MESVYLRNPTLCCTENIRFKEYFDLFSKVTSGPVLDRREFSNSVQGILDINSEQYKTLKNKCSPFALLTPNREESAFVPVKQFREGYKLYEIPVNSCLKTVNNLRKFKDKRQRLKAIFGYEGQVLCDSSDIKEDKCYVGPVLKRNVDFLLTVRVYMASRETPVYKQRKPDNRVSQEMLIPGKMTLDKLRSSIKCVEDHMDVQGDVSDRPLTEKYVSAADVYKSAMFYIGDTFYIDERFPENVDYSETIREWGKAKNLALDKKKSMETTTVDSLVVRLGYPYVYVHQSGCEHLIVFTDARFVNGNDLKQLVHYPLVTSFSIRKAQRCILCLRRYAMYILMDCEKLHYDLAFLCKKCPIKYLYVNQQKICNFSLHKYIDRVALL